MDRKYLFYALFSVVVAIILGDIWVIHMHMQTLNKNVAEEKKIKSESKIMDVPKPADETPEPSGVDETTSVVD